MKKALRILVLTLVFSMLITTAIPFASAEAPDKLTFWTFHSSAES